MNLKHVLPDILSGAACVGVAATAVLAIRETPKAHQILEERSKEKGDVLSTKEQLKAVLPAYLPAIITAGATCACIISSNDISKSTIAAATASYISLKEGFEKYRGKVDELYGEDANVKVLEDLSRDKDTERADIIPYSGVVYHIYEPISGEFFNMSMDQLLHAEQMFQRNYHIRGIANLNEFYEFLGLPKTLYGETHGWNEETSNIWYGCAWLDIWHKRVRSEDPDTPDYVEVYFDIPPIEHYDEYTCDDEIPF